VRVAIPRIAAVGVVLASLGLVLVAPGSARAQSVQGLGYGVGGIAGYSGFFGSRAGSAAHVAGGGELLAGGRAGAAGEFGFLLGTDALSITSVNGVFHAVPVGRDEPFSPFVTAGYTHMSSGEGAFDAWNIGGGADVWTSSHRALRLEFRDHVRPDVRGTVHYWSLRAGIAFR